MLQTVNVLNQILHGQLVAMFWLSNVQIKGNYEKVVDTFPAYIYLIYD